MWCGLLRKTYRSWGFLQQRSNYKKTLTQFIRVRFVAAAWLQSWYGCSGKSESYFEKEGKRIALLWLGRRTLQYITANGLGSEWAIRPRPRGLEHRPPAYIQSPEPSLLFHLMILMNYVIIFQETCQEDGSNFVLYLGFTLRIKEYLRKLIKQYIKSFLPFLKVRSFSSRIVLISSVFFSPFMSICFQFQRGISSDRLALL